MSDVHLMVRLGVWVWGSRPQSGSAGFYHVLSRGHGVAMTLTLNTRRGRVHQQLLCRVTPLTSPPWPLWKEVTTHIPHVRKEGYTPPPPWGVIYVNDFQFSVGEIPHFPNAFSYFLRVRVLNMIYIF